MMDLLGGAWIRERRLLAAFLISGTIYFTLLIIGVALEFLRQFQDILIALFLAWLLAFLIAPLVSAIQKRLRVGRGAATGGAFGVLLIGLAVALLVLAAVMVADLANFIDSWPSREEQIAAQIRELQESLGIEEPDVAALFLGLSDQIAVIGAILAGSAASIAGGAFSAVGTLALVVLLAFFMALDSHKIAVWVSRLVPDRFREQSILLQESVASSFGSFIRMQTVFAFLMFALVMVVGLVARELGGMEYIFVTAVVSGLFMFIPMIGPAFALVPPIFIAFLTSENWIVALIAVVIIIVVQTVMVNALQPKMMQESLGLHPILLFVGLLVGVQLAGLWGALFGIPILAVIVIFVNRWMDVYRPAGREPATVASDPGGGTAPGG